VLRVNQSYFFLAGAQALVDAIGLLRLLLCAAGCPTAEGLEVRDLSNISDSRAGGGIPKMPVD